MLKNNEGKIGIRQKEKEKRAVTIQYRFEKWEREKPFNCFFSLSNLF
jgi:hypothetical protein